MSNIPIKPFLSPQPEVLVLDLEREPVTENDVLVLGTDGLWDIAPNEQVAEIVQKCLDNYPISDEARYRYRFELLYSNTNFIL